MPSQTTPVPIPSPRMQHSPQRWHRRFSESKNGYSHCRPVRIEIPACEPLRHGPTGKCWLRFMAVGRLDAYPEPMPPHIRAGSLKLNRAVSLQSYCCRRREAERPSPDTQAGEA